MKIQVISDVHAEFHQDRGYAFVNQLDSTDAIMKEGMSWSPETATVLVIAGDLAPIHQYKELIPLLLKKFNHVVAVLGNHEYYDSDRQSVTYEIGRLMGRFPNFHVLEDSTVTIAGQRFIGSTLWFPNTTLARSRQGEFSDFGYIQGLGSWVYDVNQRSMEYLKRNVKPTDVVVTHHLPSQMCSRPKWWGSFLQPFFVCNMEPLMLRQHPKIWVFGHTHDSYDGMFGPGKHPTHLICNPFGYAGREENPEFKFKCDVVVPVFPK